MLVCNFPSPFSLVRHGIRIQSVSVFVVRSRWLTQGFRVLSVPRLRDSPRNRTAFAPVLLIESEQRRFFSYALNHSLLPSSLGNFDHAERLVTSVFCYPLLLGLAVFRLKSSWLSTPPLLGQLVPSKGPLQHSKMSVPLDGMLW